MSIRCLILSLLGCASLALAACASTDADAPLHPLIGSGHGIDHATVLTRDLAATSLKYTDELGFTVTPYDKYENGFENAVVYFQDKTYLEFWGVHDAALAAKSSEADILEDPDGLTWLILHVGSTDAAATWLRARGHALFGPFNNSEEPWLYRLTGLERSTIPGRKLFFIEYNEAYLASRPKDPEKDRRRETHANTAQRLHATWIGVKDLDSAVAAYEGIGFRVTRDVSLPHLQARARELSAGKGAILLVQAIEPSSPVSAALGERADRMLGVSIRVASLASARFAVTQKGRGVSDDYAGPYGRSLLVPASRAGGAWVEFFE